MVSQPVVAGWLAGLLVGEPGAGLATGVVLQAVWGRSFALGAASFPLVGPATVAAAALAAWAARTVGEPWGAVTIPEAGPLAVSLLVAFALAEIGRRIVLALRRRRGRLMRVALMAARTGRGDTLVRLNLRGVGEGALLGAALVSTGLGIGWPLATFASDLPSVDGRWVALPVLGAGLGLSLSLVLRGRSGWWWWAALAGAAALGWGLR